MELRCISSSRHPGSPRSDVSARARSSPVTNRITHFVVQYRYALGICSFSLLLATTVLSLLHFRLPDFSDPSADFVTIGTDRSAALEQFRALLAYTDRVPQSVRVHSIHEHHHRPQRSVPSSQPRQFSRPTAHNYRTEKRNIPRKRRKNLNLCFYDKEWPNLWHAYASQSRIVLSLDQLTWNGQREDAASRGATAGTWFTNPHALTSLCELQHRIERLVSYKHECLYRSNQPSLSEDRCCPMWSLPNLIAALLNKSSCDEIEPRDAHAVGQLLTDCLPAFRNGTLKRSCWDHYGSDPRLLCPLVEPVGCLQSPLIPFILATSLPDRSPQADNWRTTLFQLPLRQANSLLVWLELEEFYHSGNLTYGLQVPVYILGSYMHTYNELVTELLARDTWWLGLGLTLLLFLLFLGTCNLWLPMLTVLGIGWSLLIAFAVYTQLFQIPRFPLINLMAIVLAIGLGADDLLIYFQIWTFSKHKVPNLNPQPNRPDGSDRICRCKCIRERPKRETQPPSPNSDDLVQSGRSSSTDHSSSPKPDIVGRLRFTLSHAVPSMLLTTVSTILGLLVNLFSSIVAVKRFALFSSLVVTSNLLFVLLIAPLFFLLCDSRCADSEFCCCISPFHANRLPTPPDSVMFSSWFATLIRRGRWIISTSFLVGFPTTCYLLFGERRFDLPQSSSQSASFLRPYHPFEMFLNQQSDWFWTERELHHWENLIQVNIVWGIVPADSRSFWTYSDADQYNPTRWIPDSQLNITSIEARQWLYWFCDTQLKQIPYLLHTHWFEHRPDSLSWFDPTLLDGQIHLPIWCPLGHYPSSLDNYVFARACSLPNSQCCLNGSGLDTESAPAYRYLQCLIEWVSQESHRLPRESLGSGFRFVAPPSSSLSTNEPVGLVLTVVTNLTLSMSYSVLRRSLDELTQWFRHSLLTFPCPISQPYLVVPSLVNFEVITNVAEYLPWSILSAILMASFLVLLSCRNLLLCVISLFNLIGCLMIAILLLATLDNWTLGVVEGLVLSLASGLAIDPCLHLAQTVSRIQKTRACCEPGGRSGHVLHQALCMLNPAVIGSTWSTALSGLCMLSCQLLCYHQIGVFLITLMACSWSICYIAFATNLACLDDLLLWVRR
ncbi:Protein dispatched 1 [Fasciola gigantica]|uniref:Protein dispatched 1 n=1 Tax=Fasciola gigantica TaxID=46835 RepID=A0A504Z3K4_FASGI|nr:Protein dispatched 1 [Fasciola gigantica]